MTFSPPRPLLALTLLTGLLPAAPAAAADAETLKADIDSFFHRLELLAPGRVHWDGADTIEVKQEGNEAAATVVNGRFSLHKEPDDAAPIATIAFDRIDIREHPAATGGDLTDVAISLPNVAIKADEGELDLTINSGKATVILQGDAERQRDMSLDIAGVRLDDKKHGAWATIGPIAGSWKTIRNDDGSWRGPFSLELKQLAFLVPDGDVAGSVERIAYAGENAGPSLAEIDAFRDRAVEVRDNFQHDPAKRSREMLALLPKVFSSFSYSKGTATVEQIVAKRQSGEALVSLAKVWLAGGISGFDSDKAALRITIGHDGLTLAPALAPAARVPRTADLDFGIEGIDTAVLRKLAEAASHIDADASPEDRDKTSQQLLFGAMALQPVFRIYDAMVNFRDVSIAANGEAKRAQPAPIGYSASGAVTVRGVDALEELLPARLNQTFLPLIKYLGRPDKAAGGAAVIDYQVTSDLDDLLKLNGNDISAWFRTPRVAEGQPRVLRLQDPPLNGDDVRAVQKALTPPAGKSFADGVYDGATAVAVAAFQKQAGLDVNGVVNAKTRDKLGVTAPPAAAPPASPPTSPASPAKPGPANPAAPKN
jgi:putative peptidoglycan binding protein